MIIIQLDLDSIERLDLNSVKILQTVLNTEDLNTIETEEECVVFKRAKFEPEKYYYSEYKSVEKILGKIYQDIDNLCKDKILIVAFGKANKQIYAGLEELRRAKIELSKKINFLCVGDKQSQNKMEWIINKVNANFVGQYNDKKDPKMDSINWLKNMFFFGVFGGGVMAVFSNNIFEFIWGVASGVSIGFFIASLIQDLGVKKYHTFSSYLERNVGGIQEVIKKWEEENQRKESGY